MTRLLALRAAWPLTLALAALPGRALASGPDGAVEDVRGITVSCRTWGGEWARPEMRELMATLPDVGANWLAIHPYAHVSRETGELRWRSSESPDHVVRPIRWARELGLRIMVKPHLSYWGEFAWRGEVGWGDDAVRWRRFEESYRRWIVELARTCQAEGADLFVVGTELRLAEAREAFWARVIREIRAAYRGPLTYAANWDDYERVPFWDELDYVGVQAYFPLTQERQPSAASVRAAWRRHARRLAAFSDRVGRPLLITEVGYTSSPDAAARPWESRRGPGPTDLQALCLRTALETAAATPEIRGAFVWKWFPTTRSQGPGDFTVQTPEFKGLLREAWLAP